MSPTRRALFSTTALVTVAGAVAACSGGATTTTTVDQVIAGVQGVISYLGPVLPLVAAFVPGAVAFVPVVETGLTVATGLLNTLSSTMTTVAAQPIVKQITGSLYGVLDAGDQAIALIPDPTRRATATAILGEARVVVGLLDTFVTGTVATVFPTARLQTARHVHVRQVR